MILVIITQLYELSWLMLNVIVLSVGEYCTAAVMMQATITTVCVR